MKNDKVDFIMNGIMALIFSIVASSGIMMLFSRPGPHPRDLFEFLRHPIMPPFKMLLKIHVWFGLILTIFVITHAIRHWKWITAMIALINEDCKKQSEAVPADTTPPSPPPENLSE
ncbi:MAG: DUF4405 domain-containing protein [Candidatus Eremiobacteraeota bacterium]|nr:DUF4405 domain-containing protein [Candidatus Eremiobacteraeota bacterium]